MHVHYKMKLKEDLKSGEWSGYINSHFEVSIVEQETSSATINSMLAILRERHPKPVQIHLHIEWNNE